MATLNRTPLLPRERRLVLGVPHTTLMALLLTALPCALACDDETTDGAADGGGDTAADSATDAPADAAGNGERTLDSCETSIDDGVPVFYSTFFRCVTATVDGSTVTLESESLPPHLSYYYGEGDPNYAPFDTSRGPDYQPNPNNLSAQNVRVRIPAEPVARGGTIDEARVDGVVDTDDEEYPLGAVGVALDSVALFNPLAAPGHDIAEERFTFDDYNAHPTDQGAYHYHTESPGPLEVLLAMGWVTDATPGQAAIELYGIMCDGTVILGCTELDGSTPDDGDFDAQNGHVHDIEDTGGTVYFADRYHTHLCPEQYPGHPYTPEIQYYTTCNR